MERNHVARLTEMLMEFEVIPTVFVAQVYLKLGQGCIIFTENTVFRIAREARWYLVENVVAFLLLLL